MLASIFKFVECIQFKGFENAETKRLSLINTKGLRSRKYLQGCITASSRRKFANSNQSEYFF